LSSLVELAKEKGSRTETDLDSLVVAVGYTMQPVRLGVAAL
jgi:hypothetical protein